MQNQWGLNNQPNQQERQSFDNQGRPHESRKHRRTEDYLHEDSAIFSPLQHDFSAALSTAGSSMLNFTETLDQPNLSLDLDFDVSKFTNPALSSQTTLFETPLSTTSYPSTPTKPTKKAFPLPKPVSPILPCDDDGKHVPLNNELCYITDSSGVIVSVEDSVWNKFIEDNMDPALTNAVRTTFFPSIINRSLFEFISEPKTQSFFRHILSVIVSGAQPRFQYQWFCDSPTIERKMLMNVAGMSAGNTRLVLWMSKILYEKPKKVPALYMLKPEIPTAAVDAKAAKSKINRTVCSYCHRILVSRKEINEIADFLELLVADSKTPLVDAESRLPIIGLRGKLGQQLFNSISTGDTFRGEKGKASSPDHVWLTPEQYYSAFDAKSDNTVVNYGICEVCYHEIMIAFFPKEWSIGMSEASSGVKTAILSC